MSRQTGSSEMQNRIDELQALYREWKQRLPQLQAEQENWQRSMHIMRELSAFYFGGEYQQYRQALEDGQPVHLHTPGEYSIMGEDTLWDAFHEHRQLAWQRLRSAVSVLDNEVKEQD